MRHSVYYYYYGKRPDGLSLSHAKMESLGRTMASTLAESYVEAAATASGAVAEQAAQRKLDKCRDAFLTTAFNQLQ